MPRPNEYHWTFGNGAHLEFQNGTTLISHPATPMNTTEGCASISDPQSGALLFYTDGRTLWDANHNVISTGIGGHASSTHSAIIVPPPSGANNYHVFATSGVSVENDLIHSSYSVSGSGSSVNVQQVTPPTATFGGILTPERMAAVSNADCTGYWIVTQELDTDIFHTISLTTDTPVIMPPQTPGTPIQTRNPGEVGYMKFSPNGKLLAYCDYTSNEVVICDFDNATGTLNYRHKIYEIAGPYGLEFSPDSQMIYFTAFNEARLFQAPIGTVDIANTFSVLINDGLIPPDREYLAALQLGPNDKIYALRTAEPFLAVINTPNVTGLGCGYQDYEVDGNGNRIEVETSGQYGLPTFTRLSDNCVIDENGRCAQIADAVNTQLGAQAIENPNHLKPCDGMVEGYLGQARVIPITATNQAFVEWSSDWNNAKGDVKAFCDPLYSGLLDLLAEKFH